MAKSRQTVKKTVIIKYQKTIIIIIKPHLRRKEYV